VHSLLHGLDIVLVKTRFPENIGMVARACANMGCTSLSLVAPERWDRAKAAPLATARGQAILDGLAVCHSLPQALAQSVLVLGTTARTGGWRQALLGPEQAALLVAAALGNGDRVSLVFGSEDRGLVNEDILHCQRLVSIPTDAAASSLNLAQAVLIMLYECARAVRTASLGRRARASAVPREPSLTAVEQEKLLKTVHDLLLQIDYLHGDNPEYFFMPWRRFFGRTKLLRHEYDALMGCCRQIRNKLVQRRSS
jgi:tRNA/rRNA methyltransferase